MPDPVIDLSEGLGAVIRWLRQNGPRGPMSQAELGRRAGGVRRQAVTQWEKGRTMPDLQTTLLIASALGVAGWGLLRAGQAMAGGAAVGAAVALAMEAAEEAAQAPDPKSAVSKSERRMP